jgi:excisionase family DNA binding protein
MKYLDLKELAEITTIPVPTLRQYIEAGLPCYRMSRKIRVKPEEFVEWMQQFRYNNSHNNNYNQLDFSDFLDDTLA